VRVLDWVCLRREGVQIDLPHSYFVMLSPILYERNILKAIHRSPHWPQRHSELPWVRHRQYVALQQSDLRGVAAHRAMQDYGTEIYIILPDRELRGIAGTQGYLILRHRELPSIAAQRTRLQHLHAHKVLCAVEVLKGSCLQSNFGILHISCTIASTFASTVSIQDYILRQEIDRGCVL
jgi:hypothetical protein